MTYHRTNSPAITDEEVLSLINSGQLVVRAEGELPIEVWKWHGRRHRYEQLAVHTCDEDGRLRVKLRLGARGRDGRQRTIYLNKLVWMFGHRRAVPDGYMIDHRNENCQDDRFDNLELMTDTESHRQGNRIQSDAAVSFNVEEF